MGTSLDPLFANVRHRFTQWRERYHKWYATDVLNRRLYTALGCARRQFNWQLRASTNQSVTWREFRLGRQSDDHTHIGIRAFTTIAFGKKLVVVGTYLTITELATAVTLNVGTIPQLDVRMEYWPALPSDQDDWETEHPEFSDARSLDFLLGS